MTTTINKRLLAVWLALSGLTLIYIWIDHRADQDGAPDASTAVTAVTIAIALVKLRVILREFMEVRQAPPLLARLSDLWIAIIAISLLTAHLLGTWLYS